MIITNLAFLEEVAEEAKSVEGGRWNRKHASFSSQSNTAIVYQSARANAKALAYYGDAVAIATSINDSDIAQGNF